MNIHNAGSHLVKFLKYLMLFSILMNHLGTQGKSCNEISWKTILGGTLKGKDWNFKHEGDEDWNNKELDFKSTKSCKVIYKVTWRLVFLL